MENTILLSESYLPIIAQLICAVGFAAICLVLSVLVGKRGKNRGVKNTPYECGVLPEGDGAPRFSVKFYIVAMLFVVFDIEVVFLYPWSVAFRDFVIKSPLAFWSMTAFIIALLVAFLYAWRKGVLTWSRSGQ